MIIEMLKTISSNDSLMVSLTGEEDYFKFIYEKKIIKEKGSHIKLTGSEQEILSTLNTGNLFGAASYKIYDFDQLGKPFFKWMENNTSTNLLLISSNKKLKPFQTKALKKTFRINCNKLKPYGKEVPNFIKEICKLKRASIDSEAVEILAYYVGNDLFELSSEIDKYLLYDSSRIKKETVLKLINDTAEVTLFDFTKSLCMKDYLEATRIFEKLYEDNPWGVFPSLISVVSKHIEKLIIVKDTGDPEAVVSKLKLHPYIVKSQILPQAENFTLDELMNIFYNICQIDEQIKMGFEKNKTVFDIFIRKICGSEFLVKNK